MEDMKGGSDFVIGKLLEMGFEHVLAVEAVKAVGPSIGDATDYILNDAGRYSHSASTSPKCSLDVGKALGKTPLTSSLSGKVHQSSILDHFQSPRQSKRGRIYKRTSLPVPQTIPLPDHVEEHKLLHGIECKANTGSESIEVKCPQDVEFGPDWESKVSSILRKHFGYSSLKDFQKEALAAWVAHQDCLVLAATGSGKSMCFQIPALLTGKVVVVISPLISLMHDQCLKLAKHGVSACFLGSGQPDNSVEQKAMNGMYSLIYICPETVLRLIKGLQRLAAGRGIALFAIDEVHCVSKWGHDFRPDYRKLSILRENFSVCTLKFLKSDIPLMALTATATSRVREDVIESLCMSKETKIVLTSFFRPNLRFSVMHSRTSSSASYENDFSELINSYSPSRKNVQSWRSVQTEGLDKSTSSSSSSDCPVSEMDCVRDDEDVTSARNGSRSLRKKMLSVEYLEDEVDVFQGVDDWDVSCGEFCVPSPNKDSGLGGPVDEIDPPLSLEERVKLCQEPLEDGVTIVYVPTRKETLLVAKFLCGRGIKVAAYHAGLPRSHLRQVHNEFHENKLQVVVATMAFGMGIDKLNVRRIIHYGWPQSLEAYYQEAGRAGRDGKLSDCILFANLSRAPTLLPSRRSEDQTKIAYTMLSDCHRYGMSTSQCRAKTLVEYFGEDFTHKKCLMCDVCVKGPPEMLNVKEEVDIFMQVLAAHHKHSRYADGSFDEYIEGSAHGQGRLMEEPSLRLLVSKIREQSPKYMTTDLMWWRGLARIMEYKGYIKEGDERVHVQIKYPLITNRGFDFLRSREDEHFYIFPEADMLLSVAQGKSFSTFSEWGKGWADPEIRRQRLASRRRNRKLRKRKPRSLKPDRTTARGRLSAKLLKVK